MATKPDAYIEDILGALTDPIIVYPGGWGDTLPEWLKSNITLERLVMNMKDAKGEAVTATDTEVCAYLYTVSLTLPMDEDWAQIYLYTATRVIRNWRKGEVPSDIAVNSLTESQEGKLGELKEWLFQKRLESRHSRARDEKRAEPVEVKQERFF